MDEAALPGDKICESFWRKDPRPLKRTIRELADLTAATNCSGREKSTARRSQRAVSRPSRVLQPSKRGAVPRRFLPPASPIGEFLGMDKALEIATQRLNDGTDAASILQFLAGPEATGLGIRASADLVQRLGLMPRHVVALAERVVRELDAFQAGVADGRALFQAMVVNGAVEAAQGDWLSMSRPALLRLLPGLQLPKDFRHQQFLANLIADQEGRPECLDIHATTFLGLFRHSLQ